ncbi:hypothetical protein M422DRAFT_223326 [Sphaerobolus stellatus SS14]|nr:hypothetical protein M422DRAFT_223326 [Sphaerobolus stellatus SS14]
MAEDYKASKELFVSGQTGSSVSHVNLISSAALASIALHSALRSRIFSSKYSNLLIEYALLILPLLLSMTLFADKPTTLTATLLVPVTLILYLKPRETFHSLPSSRSNSQPSSPILEPQPNAAPSTESKKPTIKVAPLPALTTYRAHMLLMTFLAILAVDFPVFPRYLAKCETFGVSLMDMGVGSFVFSQGIVSAIPLLKNPSYLSAPTGSKTIAAARKTLPLILIGLIRVILVKGSDYPEHISEYGTHWNFFLTLAALPPLEILLHPVIMYNPILAIGLAVTFAHQFLLSNTQLQMWTLNAPRISLVSHNKEGIVSVPGYFAIHILGLLTGTVLLPPAPSDFRRVQQYIRKTRDAHGAPPLELSDPKNRQDAKTAIELCSYAVLWWALLGISSLFGIGGGVSRRIANMRYVFWVTAYNTTFITGYLVCDIFFFPRIPVKRRQKKRSSTDRSAARTTDQSYIYDDDPPKKSPALLEAINLNGLPLFLLANVATGLINLTTKTMYASDTKSMVILVLYSLFLSGFAWILKDKRLWKL